MIGADVPLVVGRPRRQPRIRSSVLPYNRPTIPAHSRRIPPPYRHPRGGIVRDPAGFTRPGFGNEDGNAAATCVIYRAKLVSKRVGSAQTPRADTSRTARHAGQVAQGNLSRLRGA